MRTLHALLVVIISCSAAWLIGAEPVVSLPRSAPEAQGVSSAALLRFVEEADAKVAEMHGFMMLRHGQVIAEGWWAPYAANEPHVMFSLSKSFTSTAVGLAVDEGKLSVDDPVLKFFPEEAPKNPSKNLQGMRVRDLLTMSTGHHENDIGAFPWGSPENLIKRFLELPVAHKPGTHFVYNTPATYLQSAIVQKVTGQTVLEYLGPRLFEPLGIKRPTWEASAQGITLGGSGLSIRTEDIARFGQLYLQTGEWQGRQLIPADWVRAATARQTSNGSDPNSDWEQGYGYQFWRSRHGFYRGDGAFGQFCIVMPEHDAVIAITSGTKDMGRVMNLIWELILPAFSGAPLPEDAAGAGKLKNRLATMELTRPKGTNSSQTLSHVAGKSYVFSDNPGKVQSIMLVPGDAEGELTIVAKIGGSEHRISVTPGGWKKGMLAVDPRPIPVAASGAWTTDDTYTLKVARYQTPFVTTYRMRFSGSLIVLDTEQNVGFGETRTPQLVGETL